MTELLTSRRELLMGPMLAALPLALAATQAEADKINPDWTIVRTPGELKWQVMPDFPPQSVESVALFSAPTQSGIYYTLIKWHPGYMSAPHTYVSDRLCVVVSGTWWVNSGADFEPENTIPAPAGSFVHRIAGTPHYDGVRADGKEPAVIALCGIGPVGLKWVDPSKPGWRKV